MGLWHTQVHGGRGLRVKAVRGSDPGQLLPGNGGEKDLSGVWSCGCGWEQPRQKSLPPGARIPQGGKQESGEDQQGQVAPDVTPAARLGTVLEAGKRVWAGLRSRGLGRGLAGVAVGMPFRAA